MKKTLVLIPILFLAACVADPTAQPLAVTAVPLPTPIPTLAYLGPTNPPLECGPEAAIALAQTQSDLALAAVGEVDAVQQTTSDAAVVGQTGHKAFSQALDLMKLYDVPECLLQAKVFAVQFFEERVAAYDALGGDDSAGYETHLNNGEAARQNMVTMVNKVLGQ